MVSQRGYLRGLVCAIYNIPSCLDLLVAKTDKGVEQHIVVDDLSPAEITTKFSKLLGL